MQAIVASGSEDHEPHFVPQGTFHRGAVCQAQHFAAAAGIPQDDGAIDRPCEYARLVCIPDLAIDHAFMLQKQSFSPAGAIPNAGGIVQRP